MKTFLSAAMLASAIGFAALPGTALAEDRVIVVQPPPVVTEPAPVPDEPPTGSVTTTTTTTTTDDATPARPAIPPSGCVTSQTRKDGLLGSKTVTETDCP